MSFRTETEMFGWDPAKYKGSAGEGCDGCFTAVFNYMLIMCGIIVAIILLISISEPIGNFFSSLIKSIF